jgi:3-methyladenine DNA glycosylase AlkC
MKTILKWSKDQNVHIRRLASESVRIALPWSKKLYNAVNDFENYKKILTNLKNDKSKFVQKSVGNNLNDLYKEFPEKANEIIKEWNKDNLTKETIWIINHGLRSNRNKKWKPGQTSYNRSVYASAQKRLGLHSARSPKGSHASFRHINGGALASQAPLCRRLRRKQPERYVKYGLNLFKILNKLTE